MAAIFAGEDVRLERVGSQIILTVSEDGVRYVVSERGVHALHASCHHILDAPAECEVVRIRKASLQDIVDGH